MGIDTLIPDCLLGLGNFYPKGRNMTKQDIICMALKAELIYDEECTSPWIEETNLTPFLERFAALVASAEREKHKWDIHSCSPTCNRYACVATREAVLAEREACAELCEMLDVANPKGKSWDEGTIDCATAIRARGQA